MTNNLLSKINSLIEQYYYDVFEITKRDKTVFYIRKLIDKSLYEDLKNKFSILLNKLENTDKLKYKSNTDKLKYKSNTDKLKYKSNIANIKFIIKDLEDFL